MSAYLQLWKARLTDPRLHECLWFCAPAALIGLALRVWFTISLPYGYYHPDTHDFLTTPTELLAHGRLTIHSKTTWLTPVLYTVPFVLRLPALIVIPLGQHARGLLLILAVGAICRLWFVRWRWWIAPVTILFAIQPAMMFWEHTLMSESGFVFCAVGMALAGTLAVRRLDWESTGFLLAAMIAVAGARPEGALLAFSGVLVVALSSWPRRRPQMGKLGAALATWLGLLSVMQTSHSGLLLYASLVHLTPDQPRVVPAFGPYIRPLRDDRARERAQHVVHDVVRTGKKIAEALQAYAHDHPDSDLHLSAKRSRHSPVGNPLEQALESGPNVSLVCRRLAREAALAHPFALPGIAVNKFLATIQGDPGGEIDDYVFHQKQAFSLAGKESVNSTLGPGLIGKPLETPEQAQAFTSSHYDVDRAQWFNDLDEAWLQTQNAVHLPSTYYSPGYRLPGLPLPFFLAIVGAFSTLWFPTRNRCFQWAFLSALCGMWFVVELAAEVIPRHRFVLEAFWILYFFAFCDAACALLARILSRMRNS